jgi:ABC-type enterochelin transport system substrate-binding protein
MSKHYWMALLALLLTACSSGSDKTAATAEDLEHADRVAQEAEAQLQKNEVEIRKAMREVVVALGRSCDRVTDFEQVSDTRLKINCSYNGDTVHYTIDKTTNTIEEH